MEPTGLFALPSSGFSLPTPVFIRLPICQVEALLFGFAPMQTSGLNRIRIIAIEQKYNTLIARGIPRHRGAVDEKAHGRTVGVFIIDGEHDRLQRSIRLSPGAM